MKEFTGDYYECDDCEHIWDYTDDACPECGKNNITDLNANEVLFLSDNYEAHEKNRLIMMLTKHDDLKQN